MKIQIAYICLLETSQILDKSIPEVEGLFKQALAENIDFSLGVIPNDFSIKIGRQFYGVHLHTDALGIETLILHGLSMDRMRVVTF